jgi:auxin response factor
VRKIFIYTPDEVKKLSPKIGLPTNEEGKPSKLDCEAVVNPEDQSSIVGPGC